VNPIRYHEAKQRGSADFPLEYYDLDQFHPRYQMPCHWHEECEIILIRSGEFDLTLGQETITLGAGDSAFIASGRLHGGIPRSCTYECIVFDMRLLMKSNDRCKQQIGSIMHHHIALQTCYRSSHPLTGTVLAPLFESLRSRCEGYELITLGCLFRFFGEVYRLKAYQKANPQTGNDRKVLQLKKVFEIIENDYASHLTLDALSASVHMTPKYFCRFFREATHRTPIDYLNYYRVEMACSELVTTDKSITEIAMDAGFSNPNYFIRQFRKYKGTTPGRYQQSIRMSK